jgi:hypothetical protein
MSHLGGIDMGILVIAGILFGTVLGRFFKVFILIPACILAIVLVLARPAGIESGFFYSLLEIIVLVTSLQIGYALGMVSGELPALFGTYRRTLSPQAQTAPSRSIHVR